MENQQIINFLDSTPNQPYKFRTRNSFEINEDESKPYNPIVNIKLQY